MASSSSACSADNSDIMASAVPTRNSSVPASRHQSLSQSEQLPSHSDSTSLSLSELVNTDIVPTQNSSVPNSRHQLLSHSEQLSSSSLLSDNQPHQRAETLYLSLIEGRCRAQASKTINASRHPEDLLPDTHPDVRNLAEILFGDMIQELKKAGALHQAANVPKLHDLRLYSDYFEAELSDIASFRRPPNVSESRAIEETASFYNADSSLFGRSLLSHLEGSRSIALIPHQFKPISPLQALIVPEVVGDGSNRNISKYDKDFKEIGLLGKGGFGQVFRALHIFDNREYAVKKIRVNASQLRAIHNEVQLEELLAELRALASLQHRNIVRYYNSWPEWCTIGQRPKKLLSSGEYSDSSSGDSQPGSDESEYQSLQGGSELELRKETKKPLQESSQSSPGHDGTVVFEYSDTEPSKPSTSKLKRSLFRKPSEMSDDSDTEEVDRFSGFQAMKHEKDLIICIQMAHYPMTLEDYIWSEQSKTSNSTKTPRHCFHTLTTARVLLAILDGVEYIHRQEIIHRDLKPSNIFLSVHEGNPPPEGAINITACEACDGKSFSEGHKFIIPHIGDFGLIAKLDCSNPVNGPVDSSFQPSPFAILSSVASSKRLGTRFYSAPNKDQIICAKLDVYSLGVIAYEMVVKFDTRSERADLLGKLSNGVIEGLDGHIMEKGIRSMLCMEREKRWDCSTVRQWLHSVLKEF